MNIFLICMYLYGKNEFGAHVYSLIWLSRGVPPSMRWRIYPLDLEGLITNTCIFLLQGICGLSFKIKFASIFFKLKLINRKWTKIIDLIPVGFPVECVVIKKDVDSNAIWLSLNFEKYFRQLSALLIMPIAALKPRFHLKIENVMYALHFLSEQSHFLSHLLSTCLFSKYLKFDDQ